MRTRSLEGTDSAGWDTDRGALTFTRLFSCSLNARSHMRNKNTNPAQYPSFESCQNSNSNGGFRSVPSPQAVRPSLAFLAFPCAYLTSKLSHYDRRGFCHASVARRRRRLRRLRCRRGNAQPKVEVYSQTVVTNDMGVHVRVDDAEQDVSGLFISPLPLDAGAAVTTSFTHRC